MAEPAMKLGSAEQGKPAMRLLLTEPARATVELLQHAIQPHPKPQAAARHHPVIIFPGLASNGLPLLPLRKHCRALGHPTHDWGRGFNNGPVGDVDIWLDDLAQDVSQQLDKLDGRATLIGWSLGGFYARELGKRMPQRLRQVISIGTPFNGGADRTHAAWLLNWINPASPALDETIAAQLREPPPLPCTAIYSRDDGVVAWQSCRHDRPGKLHENVEVHGSHLGMGWNREVLGVITDRLAQREGHWRPFQPVSVPAPDGTLASPIEVK